MQQAAHAGENCLAHKMFHSTQFTQTEYEAWQTSSTGNLVSQRPYGTLVADVPIPTMVVDAKELVNRFRILANLEADNLFHPFGGITNDP